MTAPRSAQIRTLKGFTLTSEGPIPHLYRDGVYMPVRLCTPTGRSVYHIASKPLDPMRINGRLVYVAPDVYGGGV